MFKPSTQLTAVMAPGPTQDGGPCLQPGVPTPPSAPPHCRPRLRAQFRGPRPPRSRAEGGTFLLTLQETFTPTPPPHNAEPRARPTSAPTRRPPLTPSHGDAGPPGGRGQ